MKTVLILIYSYVWVSTAQPSSFMDPNSSIVVIACENQELTLNCTGQRTIYVVSGNYGRTSPNICTAGGPTTNTSCVSGNTLPILKMRCDCQSSCTVSASNTVFGDPCVYTYKYLEVRYRCERNVGCVPPINRCDISTAKEGIACTGLPLTLVCKRGIIQILNANYGRTSPNICLGYGPTTNTSCSASNSLQVFSRLCNNKNTCTIYPSYDLFGDPCLYTTKYLEAQYCCKEPTECDVSAPKDNIACTGQALSLSCGTGVIQILSASYGRTSPNICLGYGPTTNTSCSASNALAVFSRMCNNNRSCTVAPTYDLFGDPCLYTTKYLEANYCCKEPPECNASPPQDNIACPGQALTLACRTGIINIISANFGRTSPNTCQGYGPVTNTSCSASNSLQVFNRVCNNKKLCTIYPAYEVFGDPCLYTTKYLEANYCCRVPRECNVSPPQETISCYGQPLILSCKRGTIKILTANYGRTSRNVCLGNGRQTTALCSASNSFQIFSSLCNNRKSCMIQPSYEVFGDPCYFTNKYLEATYCCQGNNN